MHDQTASRTALGTAFARAAHQLIDPTPLLFADPTALPLLGPNAAESIQAMIDRHQSPYGRGLRSHVCLRARFAEDRLAEAVRQGAKWYVLVGAGFDTFALRQPDWARGLRIVEVDHPATQAAKRDMIEAAGFDIPDNLSFAAADFTRESLGDVLARHGIEDAAYFSWLGVTMYLDEAAIDASLAAMASAGVRSSLTLTFKQPDNGSIPGDAKIAEFVASLGEAFVSFFTPEQMAAKLAQHGFVTQQFLTPEKARADYFTPPRGGIPTPRDTSIVYAAR
jgi:methyltransferase (TIGR00027 family)